MNKIVLTVLIGALAVAGFFVFKSFQGENDSEDGLRVNGRVIFGITDAAASLQNVQSVVVEADELYVHSLAKGWTKVSGDARQFDLLSLKQSGEVKLFADAELDAGTYDQIKIAVNKVLVAKANQEAEAKLIAKELIFPVKLVVDGDATSSAVIDFLLDNSLHSTVKGQLVFVPVTKVETRSQATASVESDNKVFISGGRIDTSVTLGMNESGEMEANFYLGGGIKIDLVGDVVKIISDEENETQVKVSAQTAIQTSLSSGLDTAISAILVTRDGKLVWEVAGLSNLQLKKVIIDASTGAVINVQ